MSGDRTAPPAPALPTVIGYEILGELSRDRLGVVYRARQVLHHRDVALRLVDDAALGEGRDLTLFCRDARAAERVSHPGLIPLLEVGDSEGQLYLASEPPPGPSLRQRLAAGPLAPAEAARVVEAVARTVAFLHQKGVL